MASLIIVAGPNSGDYYPLAARPLVVGRDEACPVQVTDEQVSRKHVQVRRHEKTGEYVALDMKSANGVLINGRKIDAECTLFDGDVIEIGKTRIMFSTKEFKDRESALAQYHKRGEREKNTLQL